MIDLRLRSRIDPAELEDKVGKICTDDDYNLLLTRDATVRKPDGTLLCIYRRRAFDEALLDASWPALHHLKGRYDDGRNRGKAGGTERVQLWAGPRTYGKPVSSGLIGTIEMGMRGAGSSPICRLTAFTGRETEKFRSLWPLFGAIGAEFERLVPDRFAAQMAYVARTHPEWIVPGTPFSTITVNNTYPTGVHTDKGDLQEGFSNLTVLRRGAYRGGVFLFPEYRLGVDMGHGDLLLMDAHEWHGNTALQLDDPDAERISIVAYYRTKIAQCGTGPEEIAKAVERADRPHRRGLVDTGAAPAPTSSTAAGPPADYDG